MDDIAVWEVGLVVVYMSEMDLAGSSRRIVATIYPPCSHW